MIEPYAAAAMPLTDASKLFSMQGMTKTGTRSSTRQNSSAPS